MIAEINSLLIEDSTLASPIIKNELKMLTLNVNDKMTVRNSTMQNVAIDLKISARSLSLLENSKVRYHTSFEIEAFENLNLAGIIQQNDPIMSGNSDKEGTVLIYAGNPKESDPIKRENDLDQKFFFGNTSIIRGQKIMIFSDQDLTLQGSIENTVENQDGSLQVIGSCILKDDVTQDVFRCVPTNSTFTQLTNANLMDTYNRQYHSDPQSIVDVFNSMPEFYSVYIQSLQSIEMNGTIVGNRLGL